MKGKNKNEFEKKLVGSVKFLLEKFFPSVKIRRLQGRLVLEIEIEAGLCKGFGISSPNPSVHIEAQFKSISLEAVNLAEKYKKP